MFINLTLVSRHECWTTPIGEKDPWRQTSVTDKIHSWSSKASMSYHDTSLKLLSNMHYCRILAYSVVTNLTVKACAVEQCDICFTYPGRPCKCEGFWDRISRVTTNDVYVMVFFIGKETKIVQIFSAWSYLDAVRIPWKNILEDSLSCIKIPEMILSNGSLHQHPIARREVLLQSLQEQI